MRDVNGGFAEPALQRAQFVAHLNSQLEIEIGKWLVEEEKPWLEHDRARNRDPLLLTAGELARVAACKIGQTNELEDAAYPFGDFRLAQSTQPQPERHVVEHGEMRKKRIILENETDITTVRRHVVDAFAPQRYSALAKFEARDAAQCCRLTAATWAKKREELAFHDLERNWTDRDLGRISLDQAGYLQLELGHDYNGALLGCVQARTSLFQRSRYLSRF